MKPNFSLYLHLWPAGQDKSGKQIYFVGESNKLGETGKCVPDSRFEQIGWLDAEEIGQLMGGS